MLLLGGQHIDQFVPATSEISRVSICSLSDAVEPTRKKYSPVATPQLVSPMENYEPYVRILVQPQSRALRFRYKCEGRYPGALTGVGTTNEIKTYPQIKVCLIKKKHKRVSFVTLFESVSCLSIRESKSERLNTF